MTLASISRRDLLRRSAVGMLGVSVSGWLDTLAARAALLAKAGGKHKSCILLFLHGGPSHIDTFDPKPGNGEFKAIPTAVPGIEISEHLPKLAQQMKDIALIRSMSSGEGAHARARYYVHTGYREGSGGVVHPTFGSVVSATIGDPEPELPNFVSVNGGDPLGSGFLGPNHMPLFVPDAAKGVENLKASEGFLSFDRRFTLLDEMEQGFLDRKKSNAALAHKTAYDAAHKLMHSAKAKAFDLSAEPASVRSAYGSDKFGEGCLLARRLVEAGVPFVEVNLANWDTHRDNFPRVKSLSTVLDQGMSALLADLKSRGMLDDTLVICMGEFGRTPHLTGNGRGHWPRAWSSVLAGGGIKSGQVIGRTDKTGGEVEDGKVAVIDFLATICKVLEIDWTQNFHTREGRPIRVVDKGEKLIPQLLT